MATTNDALAKGLGAGTMQWLAPFQLVDKDGAVQFAVSAAGVITSGSTALDLGGAIDVAGDFSVATSKFNVASASGNTLIAGTLGVTGASTLAAVAATTVAASGLITSTVAAGSPVFKAALTTDTPTVAFSDDGTASHAPTTAPAGYLEIVVGSTPYYIPVWA